MANFIINGGLLAPQNQECVIAKFDNNEDYRKHVHVKSTKTNTKVTKPAIINNTQSPSNDKDPKLFNYNEDDVDDYERELERWYGLYGCD